MDGNIVQVYEDGGVVYRASALGGCTKALIAARLEYEPAPVPAKMQAVFDRGYNVEEIVIRKLREDGWSIWDEQATAVLHVSEKIKVVGHIDGKTLISTGSQVVRLLEIKSQTQEAWDEYNLYGWPTGLWPQYAWQVSSYMNALDLPLVLVRALWDQDKKEVVKYEVSFHDASSFWWKSVADIRLRVLLAESIAMQGIVPDICDARSYPCPYYRLHEDDVEMVDDEGLAVAAREYEISRVAVKTATQKRDTARAFLEAALAGRGGRISLATGEKVTTWEQKNPPSLNTRLLERYLRFIRGPEIARFKRQTMGSRIRVTLPKETGTDGMEVVDDDGI